MLEWLMKFSKHEERIKTLKQFGNDFLFSVLAAFLSIYIFAQGKKDDVVYELAPSPSVVSDLSEKISSEFMESQSKLTLNTAKIEAIYGRLFASTDYAWYDVPTVLVRMTGVATRERTRAVSQDFLTPYLNCIDKFKQLSRSDKIAYEAVAFLASIRGVTTDENLAFYKDISNRGRSVIGEECLAYMKSLSIFVAGVDIDKDIIEKYRKISGKGSESHIQRGDIDNIFQTISSFRQNLFDEKNRISLEWVPGANSSLESINRISKKIDNWRARCIDGEISTDERQYCLGGGAEIGQLLTENRKINEEISIAIQGHYKQTHKMSDLLFGFFVMVLIVFVPFRARLSLSDMLTAAAKSSPHP